MREEKKNILIVDSHLGFVFSLGRTLDAAGYSSWPAKSVADAQALTSELGVMVDLLIIHHSIPGANKFAEGLRKAQGELKVIGLFAGNESAFRAGHFTDSENRRPVLTSESASSYLELVHRLLPVEANNPIYSSGGASSYPYQ